MAGFLTRFSRCYNFQHLRKMEKGIFYRSISTTEMWHVSDTQSDRLASLRTLFKRSGISRGVDHVPPMGGGLVPVEDMRAREQLEIQKKVYSEASREDEESQLEKFIPVTRQVLVKTLLNEDRLLNRDERHQLEIFSASLDAYISQRFYVQLEEMKVLYDLLDPDKDTIQHRQVPLKELLDDEYWLLQKLEMLLYKANYFKIQRSNIFSLLQTHDTMEGVRVSVDPKQYSTIRLWTRGLTTVKTGAIQRLKRHAKMAFKRDKQALSSFHNVYTRVFVAVRSKKSKKLHLKIFKDVPCNELEYLVPDGKIEMSRFDKGFLASSVFLGTVAITTKLFALASNLKLDFALLGLGIAGLIGARGWVGYKNKRNKYLVNLSRTLYFKTVSNNRGVLTLLTDRAQDEEFKEALLAYLFLLSPPNRRGVPGLAYSVDSPEYDTPVTLQQRIEKWLLETFGFDKIQFDIDDALVKLDNIGLLIKHADHTLSAIPMEVALETLPHPVYQWQSLGALRDSESYEESGQVKDEDSKYYRGWH